MVYLFHIYQPPWQTREVLEENYQKFYLPLLQVLETNPNYKITLNLAGSLTEHLVNAQKFEFFNKLKQLVSKGQIELVGSAAYHPLLPLIPEEEIRRQIRLNDEINSQYLGDSWKRKGFFIPELAYSPEVSKIVRDMGFEWIGVDQESVGEVDWNQRYIDKNSGLKLLIRNRVFYKNGENKFSNNKFNVIISDGENQVSKELNDIDWSIYLKKTEPDTQHIYLTASEYFETIKHNEKETETVKANWQLTEKEKDVKSYYHLWKNDNDPIHKMLWDLLYKVIEIIKEKETDENFKLSRDNLDKGLASCTWWWVDGRIYGYNPTAIESGAYIILNAIRSLKNLEPEKRIEIEKLYSELIFEVWKRHWENFNK